MTVAELIEKLKTFDPDMLVVVEHAYDQDGYDRAKDVDSVKVRPEELRGVTLEGDIRALLIT